MDRNEELGSVESDPETNKRIRQAFLLESDIITDDEYRRNKKLIEVVKTSNLVDHNPRRLVPLKRSMLELVGYKEVLQFGGKVPIGVALPEAIHESLEGAYVMALEENRLYDQRHGFGR